MNNLSILQALVFEPRKAFAELDARPRFAWPLWLLVFTSMVTMLWYVNFVDLEWLSFQETSQSPLAANMTDEEVALRARTAAEQPGLQKVVRTVFAGVIVLIGMLISSLYYLLAGKITGTDRSFRHWMAMSAWASLPNALALVPAAIVLLTSTSAQLPNEALQPLSLNELLFHRESGQTGYVLAAQLNVWNFVTLYLATVGVKTWSGRSWLYSFLFTALPLLLIVGIWALFALR